MGINVTIAAETFEILLALVGLALLVKLVIVPARRMQPKPMQLQAWEGLPSDLLMFLLAVVVGTLLVVMVVGGTVVKMYGLKGDAAAIVSGAAAQFGMLGGVLVYGAFSPSFRAQTQQDAAKVLLSGVATFAICWPLVAVTAKAWEILVGLFGLPPEPQDLIRMFTEAKSPKMIIGLTILATVVAPITEESVFRAGIFRFLHSRAPRSLALLLPALLFASLHVNWTTLEGFGSFAPLFVLALVFSVAYERTGNIATTMVAHALFNLNTIVLIYCGLSQ